MMLNVIESVQNKIRDFRPTYEKGEAMVCVQLIEPVLIGLGWDIQNDPDSIVKNVKAEGGIPDYTLKLEGKPCLYIEAKKLGTHLNPSNRGDTPLHQLSKYCSDNGVDYGLLTDGEKWLLFKAYESGTTIDQRIIWKLDLSQKENIREIESRLVHLSHSNISRLPKMLIILDKLEKLWEKLTSERAPIVQGLIIVLMNEWKVHFPNDELEEITVEDFVKIWLEKLIKTQNGEGTIKGPDDGNDGREFHPRASKDVLTMTAQWVLDQGRLKVPIPTGRRFIVNNEPKDPSGRDFHTPYELKKDSIYLETCFSSRECETKAKELLEYCDFDPDILKVDWIQVGNGWKPKKMRIK